MPGSDKETDNGYESCLEDGSEGHGEDKWGLGTASDDVAPEIAR